MRLVDATWVALLLVAAASSARGEDDGSTVAVVVDGREAPARVYRTHGGTGVDAEDRLWVKGFLVRRGEERSLRFSGDYERLWRVEDDDGLRLVGVIAGPPRGVGDEGESVRGITYAAAADWADALSGLADADLATLEAIRVGHWSERVAARLARADFARVALQIAAGDGEPVPELPAPLRHLVLHAGWNASTRDLSTIARLTELRLLSLGRTDDGAVTDARPLASLVELRCLALCGRTLRSTDPLRGLVNLRVLDAGDCDALDSVEFAKALVSLESLAITGTQVSDLSPLSGLPALRAVDASSAPVATLPQGRTPSLRLLRVTTADLAPGEAARFAAANAECRLEQGRYGRFVAAVASADRVIVRSGGTCHRSGKERTLAEVQGPEAVRRLLAICRVDDTLGDRCMCCGSPTFEFWSGDRLLAQVGLHHGHALRWHEGAWEDDAILTSGAARRLAAWLADHGVPEPQEARDGAIRARATVRRRAQRRAELLSIEVRDAIRAAKDDSPDPFARYDLGVRIPLLFRLLDVGGADWNETVTRAAIASLRRAPAGDVLAVAASPPDEEIARGAGWWLLEHGGANAEAPETVVRVAIREAKRFLGSDDEAERGTAIRGLRSFRVPESVALLRAVLAPRASDALGPAETPRNLRDAAISLVHLEDRESLARIREVLMTAEGPMDEDLQSRLRSLEGR